jgi:hypothetical protein
VRVLVAQFIALATVVSSGPAQAGVIDPADFGSQAQVETFDSQPVGGSAGPLKLNGVTYDFIPSVYQIVAFDKLNYMCIAGTCLGNLASGAPWIITLSNPVDRVGGYLSGAGNSLVASQTDISYFDANHVRIGGTFHPSALPNSSNSPFFFGFEDEADKIKFVLIQPSSGLFITTLDNFTTEVVAAVPELSTWAMMIVGFAGISVMTYRSRRASRLQPDQI